MKSLTTAVFIILFGPILLIGQKKESQALTISGKQFTLSSVLQPQTGTIVLPFLDGKALSGSKERFGILFKNAQAKNTVLEIGDAAGKVVKTVTLNDYLGKSKTGGVKMTLNTTSHDNRSSEVRHDIALASGNVTLITKVLLSGDKENPNIPEQFIVTYSLVTTSEGQFSLRLLFPVDGTVQTTANGAVLSGKSAATSIALSVLPKSEKIEFQKGILSVKSPVVTVNGEMPVLWLVAESASGGSFAASKTSAAQKVTNTFNANQEPNLVIVNRVDKQDAQPGDTVRYSLTCKNIGAGDATNIQLTSPISAGTTYLEGSASAEGTDVSFEKENVPAPQESRVTSIKWKLKEALKSGNEITVDFRVVIQ